MFDLFVSKERLETQWSGCHVNDVGNDHQNSKLINECIYDTFVTTYAAHLILTSIGLLCGGIDRPRNSYKVH